MNLTRIPLYVDGVEYAIEPPRGYGQRLGGRFYKTTAYLKGVAVAEYSIPVELFEPGTTIGKSLTGGHWFSLKPNQ